MEDAWEIHKENIQRLYIKEDKTCQQVAAEMREEYGFDAKYAHSILSRCVSDFV